MKNLKLSLQDRARLELEIRRRGLNKPLSFADWLVKTQPLLTWNAPHLELIRSKLMDVVEGRQKKLMIFTPPRHGKSQQNTISLPAWYLERWPANRVIIGAYNSTLAEKFSRKARKLTRAKLSNDRTAVDDWETVAGGGLRAVGVGGGITGMGGNLILIDDPVKSREEANSPRYREKCWDWYTDDLYTRLEPGGAIVLTMCMTGNTPVLMDDGKYCSLKDVKIGDRVATYDNGVLSSSLVLNHKNNHGDFIFKITTTCGKVVRANARHPFLIEDKGELKWIRLQNLTTGHRIVTLKDNGESGPVSNAVSKGAKAPPKQKGIVTRIITRLSGQVVTDLPQLTQYPGEMQDLKGITALDSLNTMQCLQHKTGNVLYATSHQARTSERIGGTSYASTIATIPTKLGRYCVTIATSLLDMLKQRKMQKQWPDTSDFTTTQIESIEADGVEDVFDVQIDKTENFIANGLVSHNTRWHDDDLAGRILASDDGPNWEVVTLPAFANHGDLLEREVGAALWPDRYDETALNEIRSILGAHSFNALYQQNPIPDEGDYFKAADCQWYDEKPKRMHIYGASDFAVTDGSGDYTEHGIFGIDEHDDLYILDWWTGQTTADVWIENELDLIHKHKPLMWVGEGGPIRRAIEPFLVKRARERNVYCRFEWLNSIHDKPTRARAFQARWSMRKVYLPKNQPWADRLLSQLTRFPAGANDDAVDVCSLIGRALDEIHGATKPEPEIKPDTDRWDKAFDDEPENDWKSE